MALGIRDLLDLGSLVPGGEIIILQHPHPWLCCKRPDLEALYRGIGLGLDQPETKLEFYRRAAALASFLKEGHTLVDPGFQNLRPTRRQVAFFPLKSLSSEASYMSRRTRDDNVLLTLFDDDMNADYKIKVGCFKTRRDSNIAATIIQVNENSAMIEDDVCATKAVKLLGPGGRAPGQPFNPDFVV